MLGFGRGVQGSKVVLPLMLAVAGVWGLGASGSQAQISANFTADNTDGFTTYGTSQNFTYNPSQTYQFNVTGQSGSGGAGQLDTNATIPLSDFTSSPTTTLTVSWRTRTQGEVVGQSTTPPIFDSAPYEGLASDVMNLGVAIAPNAAVSPEQTPAYVLEMTYDPTQMYNMYQVPGSLTIGSTLEDIWHHNGMSVEYVNPSGYWVPAVQGDYLTGSALTTAMEGYQGSWAQFQSAFGVTAGNLADYVGAWGAADPGTSDYTTWAIIDHASTFAVVPEPSTLALSGLVLSGLSLRRRSRA